jgi:hypothetical protein
MNPVAVGLILMATVVGVAVARPNARPQQQAWRVPYHHTEPRLWCDSSPCDFYCAIDFPAAGEHAVGAVNVKRLTMFAYDNTGPFTNVWVSLHKTYGPTSGAQAMASTETWDSPKSPQTVMDTSINNNPIFRTQEAHLYILMEDTSYWVSGFHVHYTWWVRACAQ